MQLLARHRRRISKTNYRKRLGLLKSGKVRLVARKTNKRIIAQLVKYEPDGDKIIISASSSDLKKLGWKNTFKNLPSAYLTGFLIGKKAKGKGIKNAILDMGLHTSTKGSRIFAFAKGAADGGLNIPVSQKIIPNPERIRGDHIKANNEFDAVLAKIK